MTSSAQRTIEEIDRLVARERALTSPRGPAERSMPFSPEPSKKRALCDASRALEAIEAPYALIGGVAVGIHSDVPRATRDVDVAVASSVDRGRVREAMEAVGFEFRGEFEHTVNFRHSSGEPVQLVFGTEFDGAIARAQQVEVDGQAIALVTKHDLIEMKERSGADPRRRRSRALLDQSDVALLRGDVPDEDEGW